MVKGQVISNPTISLQRVVVPTRNLGRAVVKPDRGTIFVSFFSFSQYFNSFCIFIVMILSQSLFLLSGVQWLNLNGEDESRLSTVPEEVSQFCIFYCYSYATKNKKKALEKHCWEGLFSVSRCPLCLLYMYLFPVPLHFLCSISLPSSCIAYPFSQCYLVAQNILTPYLF